MKIDSIPVLTGAFCLALSMSGLSPTARADDAAPPDVKIVVQNESVVAGAPIIVKYSIANNTDTPLFLREQDLPGARWVSFDLLDEEGKPAKLLGPGRPRPPIDDNFGQRNIGRQAAIERQIATG